MLQRKILLIVGMPALFFPAEQFLKEKDCQVCAMSYSSFKALDVEQKVLNTGITEIIFLETTFKRTSYISDYLLTQANIESKVKMHWKDPDPKKNPPIPGVEKFEELAELFKEEKSVAAVAA